MEFLTFGQFFNGDAFTIGDFVDRNLAPGWLKRYLAAKRTVEAALSASDAAGAIRAAVFRPSLIWDW